MTAVPHIYRIDYFCRINLSDIFQLFLCLPSLFSKDFTTTFQCSLLAPPGNGLLLVFEARILSHSAYSLVNIPITLCRSQNDNELVMN